MSSFTQKFGLLIKKTRSEKGLSQENLAELAHLSRSYLGEIERGVSVPSLETVGKLASALGEKPSLLISKCE